MTAAMNGGPTGGPWLLGIDFGTTYTCAAVREGDHIRELQVDGYTQMPSAVFLDADGELLVGRAAESRGALAPESFEATPKRVPWRRAPTAFCWATSTSRSPRSSAPCWPLSGGRRSSSTGGAARRGPPHASGDVAGAGRRLLREAGRGRHGRSDAGQGA